MTRPNGILMSMELDDIRSRIIPVLNRHGVKRAAIFGSFVRGEEKEGSDIDILIEFTENERKSLLDLAGLKIDLEEALGRTVDVVEYATLHPRVKDSILKEQIVIA